MNRVFILLASVLSMGSTAFGWNDKQQFKDDYSCGENMPMCEANFIYLFCETNQDASRAQSGQIEWAPSSIDAYCDFTNQDEDNSWRTGWRRSRLTAGCKAQLRTFGNHVYRCWDQNKDAAVIATNQKLVGDKQTAYSQWQPTYQQIYAKQKNAENDFQKAKGLHDQAQQKANEDLLAATSPDRNALWNTLNGQSSQISDLGRQTKSMLQQNDAMQKNLDLMKQQDQSFLDEFNTKLNEYDGLVPRLQIAIMNDKKDVDRITSWTTDASSLANSDLATTAQVDAMLGEIHRRTGSCTLKVCEQTRASAVIKDLRQKLSFLTTFEKAHVSWMKNMYMPLLFAKTYSMSSSLQQSLQNFDKLIDDRETIFSDDLSALLEHPDVCDVYKRIAPLLQARKAIIEMDKSVVNIDNLAVQFQNQLDAALARAQTALDGIDAKKKILGIASSFDDLISHGKITEAKFASAQAHNALMIIVNDLQANHQGANIEDVKNLVEQTCQEIDKKSGSYLSLSGANGLLWTRLRFLMVNMSDVDDLVHKNLKFQNLWMNDIAPKIYGSLGTGLWQEIVPPVFNDWDSLLLYEGKISKAEGTLSEMTSNIQGG